MTPASASRLTLLLSLALLVTPRTGAAAGPVRTRKASLAPLFNPHTRFKPKQTVLLRFRASDAAGAPIARDAIAFSLRHGSTDSPVALPARELKRGLFEVRFTPRGPGAYAIVAQIRGAPPDSVAPVRVGVVGVVDGLVEQPPEADLDVAARARSR